MIPHTAPPHWPDARLGRFAAAICRSTPELRDDPRSRDLIDKCRVALLGIPDDTGIALNHGRVGAREGPHALRAALARYGTATPMGAPDAPPPTLPHVFDAGDIIPGRDIHETHDRVTAATAALLDLGLFPIAIGGGHDLTFPFVRAVAARLPGMHGVYLDAHLDVRPETGSGMPFRKLIEDCHVARLTVVGLDPLANTDEHFRWFTEHHGRAVEAGDPALAFTPGAPTFCSIDLDAIDQSAAPGVSAMNPAGISSRTASAYAHAAGRTASVRCFDIMELSPPHDEHHRTARLAAHLFLTFLHGFAHRA
jgi:arginase family enzyme